MTLKAFSSLETILTVNGRIINGNPTEENIYEWENKVDRVTTTEAIDSTGVFNINPNKAGTLTVRLAAFHSANNYFADLYQELDLGGNTVPYTVQLKRNGGDFLIAGLFLISKPSTGSIGIEAESRVWTFVTPSALVNQGALVNTGI